MALIWTLGLQEPAEHIPDSPQTTVPSRLPSFCFGNTFQTHTPTNVVLAPCLSLHLHVVDIKSFVVFLLTKAWLHREAVVCWLHREGVVYYGNREE